MQRGVTEGMEDVITRMHDRSGGKTYHDVRYNFMLHDTMPRCSVEGNSGRGRRRERGKVTSMPLGSKALKFLLGTVSHSAPEATIGRLA